MGKLEDKFVKLCGDYFSSNDGYSIRGEQGVFSFAMVVWLGIQQRLKGNSLRESINSFLQQVKDSQVDFLVSRVNCKLRDGEVSANTGGISRARDRYQLSQVKELFYAVCNQIFKQPSLDSKQRNIYVLDGQVTVISRSDSNLEYFSPSGNGEGELHFPRIRVISAHEVRSGIATEVAVGDWHTSEVGLSREVASRLPKESLLIMDRGFAKPTFLEVVNQQNVKILVRLKDSHGSKLLGENCASVAEKNVIWASRVADGRLIELSGRVIYYRSQIKGFRSSEFYFFTTDTILPAEELAELYKQRVRVEVFIRDIKQTLKMSFIRSRKGENVAKEIFIAYLAFNMIRAIMEDAANALNLPVERISFTSTISLVKTYASSFARAKTSAQIDKTQRQFYKHIFQSKLPNRNKERSYPRVVKFPRDKYQTAGIIRKSQQGDL